MRRFAALIALFVLSLSRFGAVAMPSSADARSIGRIETHELAAPAVRAVAHVLHDATRSQPRPLVPWLAAASVATFGVGPTIGSARGAFGDVGRVAPSAWRAFTYDATAPPTLS